MSDSEDEDSPLLLDPDAIDTIAKNAFWIPSGWCIHGPKCMRNWCMSADNPAQKMYKHKTKVEGGARVEVDCQKGLLIVRLTNPHKTSGKTDMTKANVDYPAVIAAFEDPQMCFLEGVMRPPRAVTKFPDATSTSTSSTSSSSSSGWSLTPYREETGSSSSGTAAAKSAGWSITPYREEIGPQIPLKPKAPEEKERRRRVAKPAHMFIESEVSLAALGRMDTNPDGSEVPWRKFRIQKKFDAEEEERKAALVRKVAGALKDKDWEPGDEEASGSSSSSWRPGTKQQEVEQYGPKVPGDFRAAMQEEMGRREDRGGQEVRRQEQEVRRQEQGETYVMRQLTGDLPYGSRPDRYSGRWYKVKESAAGSSEPPVLEPTAAVLDFRKRRAETAAERIAAKAVKSHKANLEEFNDLMEKLPVHNEQRKINWYKF